MEESEPLVDRAHDDPGSPWPGRQPGQGPWRSLSREASDVWAASKQVPASNKPRWGVVTTCTLIVCTTIVLGMLALLFALRPVDDGQPPACRKSAVIGMAQLGEHHSGPHLIVWSGMGHGQVVFQDLYTFSMDTRRWKRLHSEPSLQPRSRAAAAGGPEGAEPAARWKAGVVQSSELQGILVTDGFTPDPTPPSGARNGYDGDAWLLKLPSLEWQPAAPSMSGGSHSPSARRAHTANLYTAADGSIKMVVYAGRTHHEKLLSDVWVGTVAWPHITWERLFDPKAAPTAASFPAPRKGHTAVLVDEDTGSKLLIFGGRNDELGGTYFSDLWAFDLATRTWEEIVPAAGDAPPPRDHHGAAFSRGRMLVYGGRTGTTHDTATPLSDVWSFDWAGRVWHKELSPPEFGLHPLPRFLFSYLQYTPPNSTEDRLLMFGGETGEETCKMNDVWELNLVTLTWRQLSPISWSKHRCRRIYG